MTDKAQKLLARLKRVILQKTAILMKENDRRNLHVDLEAFLAFLLQRATSAIEPILRA